MITFRKITKNNFEDIINLDAGKEGDKHVAKNYYSLLEAFFEHSINDIKGIYLNKKLVGMVFYYSFNNTIWLHRLMIDQKYQNKGIGKQVLETLLKKIIKEENPDKIEFLTSNPLLLSKAAKYGFKKVNNSRSKNFYQKYKEHLFVLELKK